jgi:inorganic phosphate transporter, PiT family
MGVGATKRLSAVRWGVGKRLIYAWIITIPASAGIAAVVLILINLISIA